MLQCVAACCSVLQCRGTHVEALEFTLLNSLAAATRTTTAPATAHMRYRNTLQHALQQVQAVEWISLHSLAAAISCNSCCNALQKLLQHPAIELQHVLQQVQAVEWISLNSLQYTLQPTYCNTHCNTHCNRYRQSNGSRSIHYTHCNPHTATHTATRAATGRGSRMDLAQFSRGNFCLLQPPPHALKGRCAGVLQCVAVCCSVWQCVAVCCNAQR